MNQLSIWWLAIRPKTLSISVAPVILGSALAWHDQSTFSLLTFVVVLLSCLCIQIGTNLYNDAADFELGADTHERLGPKRAAQQGWLSLSQIKQGAIISFSIAFIAGIYLAWLGGVPIIILGVLSIICGYAYTGGPKPIAYSPLGEVFVLVFFGLAAVGGSYYLQTSNLTGKTLLLASTIGSTAAAILLVNNYRDLENDRKVNKLTLVNYLERDKTRQLYNVMLLYPYLVLILLLIAYPQDYSLTILLPLLSLPMALKSIILLKQLPVSAKLNDLLARTAQLQLVYTLLLATALLL